MSRLVFLRHAHSTANESGILSGRLSGVSLSKQGKEQAIALIDRIGASSFDQIRISPLERCHQTIQPWLSSKFAGGVKEFVIDDGLNEVDYGRWSGRKLSALRREPLWKQVQNRPATVTFPDGERMQSAQKRVLASIQECHAKRKNGVFLFISHGDVIKAAVAHLIGVPLNSFQNLVINPASLSILDFDGKSARLLCYSDTTTNISHLLGRKKVSTSLLGGGSGLIKGKRK